MNSQQGWIRCPGDVITVLLDGHKYSLVVPSTSECLSIAVNYQWSKLMPDSLVEEDRRTVNELIADRDSRISWHVLHYTVQGVAQLIYGWPMFSAARIVSTIRVGEPMFRVWCASSGVRPDASWTPADWCAMGVAWFLSGAAKKEDHTKIMAQLQLPTTLEMWGPGVTPLWVSMSEQA